MGLLTVGDAGSVIMLKRKDALWTRALLKEDDSGGMEDLDLHPTEINMASPATAAITEV